MFAVEVAVPQPKRQVRQVNLAPPMTPADPFEDIVPAQPRRETEPRLFTLRGEGPLASQLILDER